MRTLSHPIPVYNIDGTLNEAGSIHEVVDVVLCYKDHSEQVQFVVTGLGKQDAILGYTGLRSTTQRLTGLQRRSKCLAVQVAAVPAGRRLNRNVTNVRRKPATYVRAALALCPLWRMSRKTYWSSIRTLRMTPVMKRMNRIIQRLQMKLRKETGYL